MLLTLGRVALIVPEQVMIVQILYGMSPALEGHYLSSAAGLTELSMGVRA